VTSVRRRCNCAHTWRGHEPWCQSLIKGGTLFTEIPVGHIFKFAKASPCDCTFRRTDEYRYEWIASCADHSQAWKDYGKLGTYRPSNFPGCRPEHGFPGGNNTSAVLVEYNPFAAMLEADMPKPPEPLTADEIFTVALWYCLAALYLWVFAYVPYRIIKELLEWL
jgi:hypothetical protein